jgi:uncharacterized membrane-anchored protein
MIGVLRNRTLAIGAVAALQLAALGFVVWERENRVRNGTDVVLEVVPVDPRSLFQGDYVILGYPISTLSMWYGAEPKIGQDVYVTVVAGEGGTWRLGDWGYDPLSASKPGGVTLKGRIDRILTPAPTDGSGMGQVRVVYGLERFFVPEGKGLQLEQLVLDKKLSAIVSVWRDGSSTLKGLASEGRVLYETGVSAKRPEDVPPLDDAATNATAATPEVAPQAPETVQQAPASPPPPAEQTPGAP